MPIKAVIFDMNGVIIDDEPLHEQTFKDVCKRYGIDLSSEDYVNLCMGRTGVEGYVQIGKKYKLPPVPYEDLAKENSSYYQQITLGRIKAMPGILSLIGLLHSHYTLALTTSASREETRSVLETFRLQDFFTVIVTAEDIAKSKPDPEPYLLTAQKLGIEPAFCLVIEDAQNGVASAKAAGMHCVGFQNPEMAEKTGLKQDFSLADKEISDFYALTMGHIEEM